MTNIDIETCEFIEEYLRFVTYNDFCKNCKAIKFYFQQLDEKSKRFYKWYVYANVFIDEGRKNLIWHFLNVDDVDALSRLLQKNHK